MSEAVDIQGTFTPLKWGTTNISGYVVESDDETESTEQKTIEDEGGHTVTDISKFGRKTERTIEVIPASSVTTPPAAGEVFTYGAKKIRIISIQKKRVKKDVEKWTIKGNSFPGVTLT